MITKNEIITEIAKIANINTTFVFNMCKELDERYLNANKYYFAKQLKENYKSEMKNVDFKKTLNRLYQKNKDNLRKIDEEKEYEDLEG